MITQNRIEDTKNEVQPKEQEPLYIVENTGIWYISKDGDVKKLETGKFQLSGQKKE